MKKDQENHHFHNNLPKHLIANAYSVCNSRNQASCYIIKLYLHWGTIDYSKQFTRHQNVHESSQKAHFMNILGACI